MHAAERKANTVGAQCTPSLLYIVGLISGKTAANAERMTTVEAMALAQYTVYVSMMYWVRPVIICATPMPYGIPARIGTIQ
jgi:hypothetical protein